MASKTLGRYELICEVAKGQLGPLWAAFPAGTVDSPPVLIRRVSTAAPTTPDEIDALSEGAWWMLEVQDSGIAHGIDVVKTEGELGVVTEYSEGEVLRSLLRLASFKRKPISLGAGLRIAVDLIEGLEQAQSQAAPLSNGQPGFCCGGLVPDSVLVGSDGRTRLLDIGVIGPASRVAPIARHPEMAAYAAPELLDALNKADARANVYGVGVMLWEMLSGKRLFVGSTHQAVAEKVKAGGVQRLDSTKPVGGEVIPSAVADVVAKALEPDPEARFENVGQLREALEAAAPVADRSTVASLVEDLAGNTLASRRKLVEKAVSGKPILAKPSPPAAPAARPAAPSEPRVGGEAAPPPPPKRKATLLGLAPVNLGAVEPPPRDKLESLDEADLESVSKVEVLAFPTSEPPTKPSPDEVKDLAARMAEPDSAPGGGGEVIKTQFLGTPAPDVAAAIAAAKAEAKAESPKPPEASPKPPEASPKPPEVSPKPPILSPKPLTVKGDDEVEEVPISMDLIPDSTTKSDDELPTQIKLPESAAAKAAEAAITGASFLAPMATKLTAEKSPEPPPAAAAAEKPEAPPAPKPAEKTGEKKDDSAVAWVGPPGVALDTRESMPSASEIGDEPVASVVPERTRRLQKMVAVGLGAFIGLFALAIGISLLTKKSETPSAPAKTVQPTKEEPKKEEPKAEEPKKEEPKAEEPKAEEPKAEEPKPEETKPAETKPEAPVQTKPVQPKTTTKPTYIAPKTTTKPKPKAKPKFTPSGI